MVVVGIVRAAGGSGLLMSVTLRTFTLSTTAATRTPTATRATPMAASSASQSKIPYESQFINQYLTYNGYIRVLRV
jgi:hypothetical protein